MKLALLYVVGLGLAWLGLASILVGLFAWPRPGALAPAGTGLLLLLLAARLLLALVRQSLSPSKSGRLSPVR